MNDTHRLAVRMTAWVTAACLLGDSMLYIVLPIYWASFGLDALWQVGILLSVNRFVRLPLNPFVGWLYGRLRKRTGFLLAAALACLTTFAFALGTGFWMLLAARALWGAAWSMLRIGGYLTVLEAAGSSDRGRLLGSYNGIVGVGSLVGMLTGGLLADLIGVRFVALLLGAVTLAGLPLAWRFVPATTAAPAQQAASASLRSTLNAKAALTLASGFMVGVVFYGLLIASLSPLIAAHLPGGEALPVWGFALGAASVAGLVQALRWAWSPFLSPWIGRWSDGPRGRLPLYLSALGIAACGMALLPLPIPFAPWLAVLLGVMLANTAINTLSDALAADAAAGGSAVAYMTTYTTVVDVGAALGPVAAFALLGAFGLPGIGAAAAVLTALTAAAWLLWRRSPAGRSASLRKEAGLTSQ
ncbi:hypothetical protein PAESOLCIP111_04396 [Paenibacillus solanacearum]|uniref:Major facilitator superfamily (MFS) profile domain-containing protein n=1 Tax=Paenibacillus solanacearum TaxID=2048548 RepID=A0A916K482_9BACL|nr:MFS transporter [Paenibacillus solanacearum]CAG7642883.1 hypothetical protein PAESOLCIP111_04396 [Paenibacillus solanacearum]